MGLFVQKLIKKFIKPQVKLFGEGNDINLSPKSYFRNLKIKVYGNNNKICVNDFAYLHNCNITVGFPDCKIDNCIVHIGEGSSCNAMNIQLGESESEVIIGKHCMISFNVELSCTDTHSVLSADGELINKGESIKIGSHVWICKDCTILKNTEIPDNSIVAQGSVVTKKFTQQNIAIAGNPAKIVKENINWDVKRPQQYINEMKGN